GQKICRRLPTQTSHRIAHIARHHLAQGRGLRDGAKDISDQRRAERGVTAGQTLLIGANPSVERKSHTFDVLSYAQVAGSHLARSKSANIRSKKRWQIRLASGPSSLRRCR